MRVRTSVLDDRGGRALRMTEEDVVVEDSGECSLRMTEEIESEDGGSGGGRKERLAASFYHFAASLFMI